MKKSNTTIGWLATIIIVIIIFTGFAIQKYRTKPQNTFEASVNLPLTGPIAFAGKSFQDAALMAMDDLKGDSTSEKITFDWKDNAGLPANAATIAQRQASSNASIYFVGYGPSVSAAKPILEPTKKPLFAFSFQASMTKDPLIYRNLINYKIEYPLFVEYVKKRKAKNIAIIFMDQPEAHEEFSKLFIPEMIQNGWKDSDFTLYPYALSETDYRTITTRVADASPDLIIINGYQSMVASIVKALRSSNLVKDGNVIGTYDLIDVSRLTGNEAVEGMATAAPSYLINPSPKTLDFQKRFEAIHGRLPSYNDYCGYDFVLIVNELARQLPNNPTPEQLKEALQKTDFEGVSGHISFDQDGDASPPVEIAILKSGKLQSLK